MSQGEGAIMSWKESYSLGVQTTVCECEIVTLGLLNNLRQ